MINKKPGLKKLDNKKVEIKYLEKKLKVVKENMNLPPHEIKKILKEKYGYTDVTNDEMTELIIKVHENQKPQKNDIER